MGLHHFRVTKSAVFKPLIIILAALGLSACVTQNSSSNQHIYEAVRSALAAELEAIQKEAGFPGMTASVIMPDGQAINVASGLADIENETPMRPDHAMPAGSIGKTFVAATALELTAEGTLALDTPIADWIGTRDWYSGMPNGSEITLRMLLNHSSGLNVDYISSPSIFSLFQQTFGPKGVSMADLGFVYTDIALVMANTEPEFPAGEGFQYSDSNYILAGLLIEDVTGNTFYEETSRRFTQSLGLDNTVPTPRSSSTYAAGYEPDEESRLPGFPEKLTTNGRLFYDGSLEWTGGGFAMTSRDLALWAYQLFGRRGLSSTLVEEMINSTNPHVPVEAGWQYGLGVMLADDSFGQRLMHGGYIPGYSSYMEYQPRYEMAVAFQINTRSGFGANRAYADRLWKSVLEASGHAQDLSED